MSNPPLETTPPRTLVVMLTWLMPGAETALAQFRQAAAPLFTKYDVRVERVLTGAGKGQLVGDNPHEVPQLLQVVSFPSLGAFQAYTADPEYVRLAQQRDAHVRRMTAVIGLPRDVSELNPSSTSAPAQRLYAFAFVRFRPKGASALDTFNQRARALFMRHGMHVELMFDAMKVVTPVGAPLGDFAPERVIVFYLDEAAALPGYVADPEYQALAPLRDEGLAAYDFFLGKVPA